MKISQALFLYLLLLTFCTATRATAHIGWDGHTGGLVEKVSYQQGLLQIDLSGSLFRLCITDSDGTHESTLLALRDRFQHVQGKHVRLQVYPLRMRPYTPTTGSMGFGGGLVDLTIPDSSIVILETPPPLITLTDALSPLTLDLQSTPTSPLP